MYRILVADDEAIIRHVLSRELRACGYLVDLAENGKEALDKILTPPSYDLVILDNQMPKLQGIEVIREMQARKKDIKVIMLTAFGTIAKAVEVMKLGAHDFMTKPFENDELLDKVKKALPSPTEENDAQDSSIIWKSPPMANVMNTIEQIRDIPSTILLLGESGTGKGMIARYIHNSGIRSDKPFVHVNCATLPAALIESELFGHTSGAFTGATKEKKGKFEIAGDGTIFLDEIGTLPLDLQAKLLTVLQERTFEKLGSNIPQKLDSRIIAATNEDLAEQIQLGTFRKDLYYRLNVVSIHCPPLRDRKEDIEPLVTNFLSRYNQRYQRSVSISHTNTWELVLAYSWPGNVRELENFIERIVAMNISDEKNIQDIIQNLINQDTTLHDKVSTPGSSEKSGTMTDFLRDQEYIAIVNALAKNNGHRSKTAQDLGISRRSLQYKLKKYNLLKEGDR